MEQISYCKNPVHTDTSRTTINTNPYSKETARKVTSFIKSFPQYSPTPLYSLVNLAKHLGIKQLLVKDESARFGLNAFKVLGSAYAVGSHMANMLNIPIEQLTVKGLLEQYKKENHSDITLTTATDGNHGRGVAWVANYFGLKAVIYMPAGSAETRVANIAASGAKVIVTELNYDNTVALACEEANKHGRILIQDTAWDGYHEIPQLIMQGYTLIGHEILKQIKSGGLEMPTHILLQCGVGSFPAALLAFFHETAGESGLMSAFVEPNEANPFYLTAASGGDKVKSVKGSLNTIMAGLACGVPNPLAWSIAKDCCDFFFSCPDNTAATGMRILGNPLQGDPPIISGESGAATCGLLYRLMTMEDLSKAKNDLALNSNAVVLLVNTEGDTDPEAYRRIVWQGEHPFRPTPCLCNEQL